MQRLRAYSIALSLTLAALDTASAALLLIPLFEKPDAVDYFLAGVFWLSVVGELIAFRVCTVQRVRYEKKFDIHHQKRLHVGLFVFASSIEAAAADIVLLISALTAAVFTVLQIHSNVAQLLAIVLLFLSANLHCILNSRNYRYYKWYQKAIRKGVRKHE